MRAVLDTNILVSAAIKKGGKPDQILTAAESGEFQWLTSEFILAELADVLGRKHVQHKYHERVTARKREGYLMRIRNVAEVITVKTRVDAVPIDPKDNPILACGIDGAADYVVTGDPHLRALETFRGILILTPSEFLQILASQK
jgi:uncharacterized protein